LILKIFHLDRSRGSENPQSLTLRKLIEPVPCNFHELSSYQFTVLGL